LLSYFMGCIALVRCVLVWFGWGGVVSGCRLKQCFSLHPDYDPGVDSDSKRSEYQEYFLEIKMAGV